MQATHERQLEHMKLTYQRKIDKLMRYGIGSLTFSCPPKFKPGMHGGGQPLGFGRQLPPQLIVGRRPLGGGLGGGGAGRGAGGGVEGAAGECGSPRGGGGVGHLRTVGYAAQV